MSLIPGADGFCGLGGFTEGARETGRFDVLWAGNHSPLACEWHGANHPETLVACQDLMHVDWRTVPDIRDGIAVFGPACQGYTECGQPARKGKGGSHSPDEHKLRHKHMADRDTIWAVPAALDTLRPSVAVVENVPRLLLWGHARGYRGQAPGPMFVAWCGVLEAMGYHLWWGLRNTRNFGAPQDRERLIVTASQRGTLVIPESNGATSPSIGDCLDPDGFAGNRWQEIASKPERMLWRMRKAQSEAGSRCFWNNVSESRGRPLSDIFPTVTTQSGTQFCLLDAERYRVLNPREIARAQSLPESYLIPSNRGDASKLIGNAIDVRMARHIAEHAADHIQH
jgi:DNA (cytosine-5)-methyltransferase 1